MALKLESLRKLYITQLQDVYSAETQLLKALPLMEEAAHHPQLKAGYQQHTNETKRQVERLDRIFRAMGQDSEGHTCKAMEGLVKEGNEVISAKGDPDAIDAGLICAAQKIEHYEIATYGCLVRYAKTLGEHEAAELLQTTLDEEYATDDKLTALAESHINVQANHEQSN